MKWSKAFNLAMPVWLLICAGAGAINFATENKASLFDLILAMFVAYPLIAFTIRESADDIAKWRAAFWAKDDD